MKPFAITTGLALLLGCAASRPPPPPTVPALCSRDRVGDGASDWTALLLRGIDPVTQRATTPALDCTGSQVRWDGPALACADGTLARTMLPERPITAADVIVTPVSVDLSLVWVVTSRLASGDALGPVALVETTDRLRRVLALGPLRAYPRGARLRLEALGERKVLVAEGEACASADPSSCVRAARIMPLRGDRFVPDVLQGEDGRCVSPAWLELQRKDPRPSGAGWERLDLTATLAFSGQVLEVDEQVIVQELESATGAPTRVLRRAQAQRSIRLSAQGLAVSGPGLWARMTSESPSGAR